MSELIYEVDGNMGKTLKVYDDKCVISTKAGVKAALFGSLFNGDKEFYYTDITSLQFKNLGITTGYMQFEYAGSHSGNNFVSENSFTFSATLGTSKYSKLKEEMPGIYEDVQNRIQKARAVKNAPAQQIISPAEELKKFKELLDMGAISLEEFDQKKKQIWGL